MTRSKIIIIIIITWLIDMITKYKVLPIFKKECSLDQVQVNLKAIYGSLQYNRFIHSENKSPRDSVGCPFALLSIPNQVYWTKKKTTQVSTRVIDRWFYNKIRDAIDIAVIWSTCYLWPVLSNYFLISDWFCAVRIIKTTPPPNANKRFRYFSINCVITAIIKLVK